MAYAVDARVRVIDESSNYRGNSGTVISVDGSVHQVRLDGHGCQQTVPLLTAQLATEARASYVDYSNCSS